MLKEKTIFGPNSPATAPGIKAGGTGSLPSAVVQPWPSLPPPGQSPPAASVVRPFAEVARCSVKGCIFPARGSKDKRCAHHLLADREPKMFLSLQPSSFLLDQAKFGLPDPDYDYSRARDRSRLAAQRERLWEEVA